VFGLGSGVPRMMQAANPVFGWRSWRGLGFFVRGSLAFTALLGLTLRSSGTRLFGAVLEICCFFGFGGFASLQ